MKNVETMKITIQNTLPQNKEELAFIIDKLGSMLFKNDWNNINFICDEKKQISKQGLGIILIIDNFFKDNDKNTLINYLFTESINKYNC